MITNTLQESSTYDICLEERQMYCDLVEQAFDDLKKPLSDEDCSYHWWSMPINEARDIALEVTGISLAAVKLKHADLFEARRKESEAAAKKAAERWERVRKKVEEDRIKAEERERAKAEQSERMKREYRERQERKARIREEMERLKNELKALP